MTEYGFIIGSTGEIVSVTEEEMRNKVWKVSTDITEKEKVEDLKEYRMVKDGFYQQSILHVEKNKKRIHSM